MEHYKSLVEHYKKTLETLNQGGGQVQNSNAVKHSLDFLINKRNSVESFNKDDEECSSVTKSIEIKKDSGLKSQSSIFDKDGNLSIGRY